MGQNGTMINVEKILSSSRFTNASHKDALREKLFGKASEETDEVRKGIQELSLDELEMAAGGRAETQVTASESLNDEIWLERMKRNW
ncbi:MAG: hypothetical protein IKE31_02895 [Eubacterium sp.]|nr:hypothetical protein [Eubacterium sp.]